MWDESAETGTTLSRPLDLRTAERLRDIASVFRVSAHLSVDGATGCADEPAVVADALGHLACGTRVLVECRGYHVQPALVCLAAYLSDVPPDASSEATRQVTVGMPHGLHTRPSAHIALLTRLFDAEVTLSKDAGEEVDARSVLGINCLGAAHGAALRIHATGPDAEEAAATLAGYIAAAEV